MGLLERLCYSSVNLIHLFGSIENEPLLFFSAGLTVRSLKLDYLMMLKVLQLLDELQIGNKSDEDIEKESAELCSIFLADGLNYTISYLSFLKEIQVIDEEKMHKGFSGVVSMFQGFVSPGQGTSQKPTVNFKKAPGGKEMFTSLAK